MVADSEGAGLYDLPGEVWFAGDGSGARRAGGVPGYLRAAHVLPVRHLLSIAEAGTYRPLWSGGVLSELRRNLLKAGAKQGAVEHRLGQIATFFSDARVAGYEQLVDSMTSHPKDRHVLAAAVAGRADVLVTENLRDFPAEATAPYGIAVLSQDDLLLDRLDLYPRAVLDALRRQASRYRREPRTTTL